MEESCTLYHAIALLAYRDDGVARRYGAKPGVRASGHRKRGADLLYPTRSGLPGTEIFAGITVDQQLRSLVRNWEQTDDERWRAAKEKLATSVQSDDVPAFGTNGKIPREFWLTHDLDSPEVQSLKFRRSDLMRLIAGVPERRSDAWTSAAQVFQSLTVCGIDDPEDKVMQPVRSGELTAWLADDLDAAIPWLPIETRLFALGMTIHSTGKLTKGEVPMQEYAALQNVGTGSVWFRSEELQHVGLTAPVETAWRSVTDNPRRKEWKDRFNRQQQRGQNWTRGTDLAEWYTRQRGAITTAEAEELRDEACRQLFRSLLDGDFVEDKLPLRVRPHSVSDAGVSRMLPEQAELFRGFHWAGAHGQDGEPVLTNGILRELMSDVWLPARLVMTWCSDRNIRPPSWLSARSNGGVDPDSTPATGLAPADVVPRVGQSRGESVKPRKSFCDQLIDALIQIHQGGTDITSRNRGELQSLALDKAGIGRNGRGSSLPTFERALAAARRQLSAH